MQTLREFCVLSVKSKATFGGEGGWGQWQCFQRLTGRVAGGVGGWGLWFSVLYILGFSFFIFYSISIFTPPTPPYPPIIYFMIRNIYRNIIKEWEMVRKKTGGVGVGVMYFGGGRD